MSIPFSFVQDMITAGQLVRLHPVSRRASQRRALLITPHVDAVLNQEGSEDMTDERLARLRADLEAFVTERDVHPEYLYWLTPKRAGVWEVRSVDPQPSLRVLGRFISQDAFVAFLVERRDQLGGWNSPEWRRAIRTCIQRWHSIFGPYAPLIGEQPNDFFTGALDAGYFKR